MHFYWKMHFLEKCIFLIKPRFIDNLVCDIDIMYVNFYQDRTITFWDIWYSKFSYFTKSFSLLYDK